MNVENTINKNKKMKNTHIYVSV